MANMLEVNEERDVGHQNGPSITGDTPNEECGALDLSCATKPVGYTILYDVEEESPLERKRDTPERALASNRITYQKTTGPLNGKTPIIVAAPDSTQSSEPGPYDSRPTLRYQKKSVEGVGMLLPTHQNSQQECHSPRLAQEREVHTKSPGLQNVTTVQRTINGPVQRLNHTHQTSTVENERRSLQAAPDSSTRHSGAKPSSRQNYTVMLPPDAEVSPVSERQPNDCNNSVQEMRNMTEFKRIRKLLTIDVKNKLFKCNICKKGFSNPFPARRHIKSHLGARPFTCHKCGKGFNRAKTLQTHIHNQHKVTKAIPRSRVTVQGDTPTLLSQGVEAETTVTELEEVPEETEKLIQVQIQEAGKPYKCGTCPMQFASYAHLEKHVAQHRSSYRHNCTVCNKQLDSRKSLQEHLDWHRDKNHFYPCTKCPKTFYHAEGLTDHMANGHNSSGEAVSRQSPTIQENVTFSQTVRREPHTYRSNSEPVQNNIIPQPQQRSIGVASQPAKIYHPSRYVHSEPLRTDDSAESVSISSYDTTSTSTESSYYENADTHNHTKPQNEQISFKLQKIQMNASSTIEFKTKTPRRYFKCSICTSTFYKDSEYNKHMTEHEEGMTFTCMACDITFSTSSELNRHYATHPGVRPYKCTVCDKAFIQATHLKFHMRRHTGEKPYQCNVCSKRFPRHAHLQEHMFLHAGEKLHQCTVCDKRFTQPTGLRSHIKRTHPDHIKQTHKCPHCPVSFVSKQGRSLHILNVHQGEDSVSSSTSTATSTSTMADDSTCSSKQESFRTLHDAPSLGQNFKQIIALPVKMTTDKIVVYYEDKLLMEWTYDSNDT